MKYREEPQDSSKYKKEYLNGLEKLILARQKEALQSRAANRRDIFTSPEKYREAFKEMPGWPLTKPRPAPNG